MRARRELLLRLSDGVYGNAADHRSEQRVDPLQLLPRLTNSVEGVRQSVLRDGAAVSDHADRPYHLIDGTDYGCVGKD